MLAAGLEPYQVAARWLLDAITRLVASFGCDGVVLLFEASERGDRLGRTYFDGYSIIIGEGHGSRTLPFYKFRADKKLGLELLEVADVTVHTARAQVDGSFEGKPWGGRRDFKAVFAGVNGAPVEFREILDAK